MKWNQNNTPTPMVGIRQEIKDGTIAEFMESVRKWGWFNAAFYQKAYNRIAELERELENARGEK